MKIMIPNDERTARERFVDALSGFLQRQRVPMLVLTIVALVGIVSFAVYAEVSSRRAEDALVRLEDIQTRVDERQGLEDDERVEFDEEIIGELSEIIERYPRTYAAQRSFFLSGILYMEQENFAEAADSFGRVADRFPEGHLALIARANQATAYEENSQPEEAMDAYRELLTMRPDSSPLIARALFSLGRLSETLSPDSEQSRDYYERVVNEYPQSNWTSLARNRLLALSTVAP